MAHFSRFRRLFPRPRPKAGAARGRTCRPLLEALEDRLTPATYRVLTNGDAPGGAITPTGNPDEFTAATLRTAVDAANANPGADTIVFDLPAGQETITAVLNDTNHPFAFGPTAFVITDPLTIRGDPAEPGVTLSGNDSHRLFGVVAGASLTLEDLTLTGGNATGGAGGGARWGGGGGGGAGLGGAIFNNGTVSLVDSLLEGNTAGGGAGGSAGATASGDYGGGGGGSGAFPGGSVSRFGGGGGGGVGGPGGSSSGGGLGGANEDNVQAGASGKGTQGGGGGGGAVDTPGGNGTDPASAGFGGGGGGGGLNHLGGGGGFGAGGGGGSSGGEGNKGFAGGFAGFGGGGGGGGSYGDRSGVGGAGGAVVFGGGAGGAGARGLGGGGGGGLGAGGAVFNNQGATLLITNSTLTKNSATGGAAGAAGAGGNTGGAGSGLGGAVFNRDGTVTITNSTLAGNTVGGPGSTDGGALFNLADAAGQTATLTLYNSIFADSTGGSDVATQQLAGTATVNAGAPQVNIVQSGITDVGGSTVNASGVLSGPASDPLLGPLGDNGGATRTMALLPGSPALNAAEAALTPLTDQRGFARDARPDLGAFEQVADVVLPGTAGDDTLVVGRTPGGAPGDVTYTLNGGPPVSLSGVTSFTFAAGAGNDSMTVSLANGPLVTGNVAYVGGAGVDTLTLDAAGLPLGIVPGRLTAAGQAVLFAGVESTRVDNAASANTFAGPDTADRATALAGLDAAHSFVQALYLDALGRAGSLAELDGWVRFLSSPGGSREAVAGGIERSAEARDRLVRSWYVAFLGRQAQGGEEHGWVNRLLAGQTEEQVLADFLGDPVSGEFFARAQTLVGGGSPEERFVGALYQALLGRAASPAEVAGWAGTLPGLGTQGVARGLLGSAEYRAALAEACYAVLLHRPSDAGLAGWASSGLDATAMRIAFESSDEFFANG